MTCVLLDLLFEKIAFSDNHGWYLELVGHLLDECVFSENELVVFLHFVCYRRNLDLVRLIIEHPHGIDAKCVDEYGNTTLIWAVSTYYFKGNKKIGCGKLSLDLVKYLLECGVDVAARTTGYEKGVIEYLRFNLRESSMDQIDPTRDQIEELLLPYFTEQIIIFDQNRKQKLIEWNPYLKTARVTVLAQNNGESIERAETGVLLGDGRIVKYSEPERSETGYYECVSGGDVRKVEVLASITVNL